MAKKFTDKSLIGSKSDEKIEYINECVREVCINGADLNNYEKMIGKLFPNEENFYMKVSAFITECGKLSSKSSISATFIANLKYLAREIYVTDDTVKEITRFTEQELQKRKKEAERKAEEERRRREAERKAEEERKRREAQRKAEEERKRREEERKAEEEKVETVRYYVNEYVRLACIEREFSNTLRDTIKWLIWPNEHDFFNKVDSFISKCHNLRNTFIMNSDVINLNNLARKIHVTDETVKEIVKFIEKEQEQERKRETERKAEEERKRREAERKAEEERKRREAERKAEEERKRKEEYDRKVEELSKQMEERKRKEAELKAEVEHKDEEEVNNIIGFIGVSFWLAITIGVGIFGCCVSGLGGLILGSLLGSSLGLIVVGFSVNFCTSVRKKIKTKE